MPTTQIDRDASTILKVLAEAPRDEFVDRNDVAKSSGLTPERINDAVALLVDTGYAEWIQTFGTAPYDFNAVSITPRGRYETQRLAAVPEDRLTTDQDKQFRSVFEGPDYVREVTLPPAPIGSPYGFTDEDWEAMSERKHQSQVLYAVLGNQFLSDYFDTDALRRNIQTMLRGAVDRYNASPGKPPLTLDFRALSVGYGEHLFNEIARDIIGADIAVFETSDLNPNVMLEMGVALRGESECSQSSWMAGRSRHLTFLDRHGPTTVTMRRALSIPTMSENLCE